MAIYGVGEQMKIMASIFIRNEYLEEHQVKTLLEDINTFAQEIDSLVFFDLSGHNNQYLEKSLQKEYAVEYIYNTDQGEAVNWRNAMIKANFGNFDYVLLLEEGYYFENNTIGNLKKFITAHPEVEIGVITPRPMYSIAYFNKAADDYRYIKGCKLLGTLVNAKDYQRSKGFRLDFYQGYVDYEYCLQIRSTKKAIVYMENEVSRNRNYKLVEKKTLGMKFSMYEKDKLDLYYETRNRFYTWDSYITTETEFVNKDRLSYKHEIREIKLSDPKAKEKISMIKKGEQDYKQKKNRKYTG